MDKPQEFGGLAVEVAGVAWLAAEGGMIPGYGSRGIKASKGNNNSLLTAMNKTGSINLLDAASVYYSKYFSPAHDPSLPASSIVPQKPLVYKPTKTSGQTTATDNFTPSANSKPTVGSPVIQKTEATAPHLVPDDFVNLLSQKWKEHVLYGEQLPNGKYSGGHLYPGLPDKTPFPASWSEEKILHVISDIATDPTLEWIQAFGKKGATFTKKGVPVRHTIEGVREGIPIRVVVEPGGEGIITGFPHD